MFPAGIIASCLIPPAKETSLAATQTPTNRLRLGANYYICDSMYMRIVYQSKSKSIIYDAYSFILPNNSSSIYF